ncbi:MAG: undecaprenyldiphospho-muramoylpentapeptide beta-N-acetylglucosaminyltransferase [Methylophaga sp.]|nr:MAG: undecaprenyldiphospho-muramoylpentapeptide beta-N-acetylglucosaminyltransferase [Methylophaga sp.]
MTIQALIMAGGTGGHVFPALAVATAMQKHDVDIAWIGTAKGIEAKLVPEAGHPLHFIHVQGLRGNGLLGWLLAPFRLAKAVFEALRVIQRVQPDVVLGLGGFASGPGGFAAWLLRKPLVIHEQNAIPGLTNRLLSKFAQRVLEGFDNSFVNINDAQWVGNPVRASIETLSPPEQRFEGRTSPIRLLVLGGSLGARALNEVVPNAIALIEKHAIEIKHQCGERHLVDCKANYQQAGIDAEITSFIDDMATVYAWADLVICRAGALTVAELSAVGVGSLLVPFPYAVDDHQTHNAAALVDAGAAYLMSESTLTAEIMADKIKQCISDRTHLKNMAIAARTQAKVGTADHISSICLELARG